MNSALNDILNQVNKDEHFDAIRIEFARLLDIPN